MTQNKPKTARLVLEDGSIFTGMSFGYEGPATGEIVFNTAMTGYPESLTDPSYKGQILVLTYPSIGNYGVPKKSFENKLPKHFESESIHISAMIISDYSTDYHHWNAEKSLSTWLKEEKIPALHGLDTRLLTKKIREKGSMLAKIEFEENIDFYDPNKDNLVAQVSTSTLQTYGNGKLKILLVDCGVKSNIIRHLLRFDTTVIRVPWDYDFTDIEYDGLFISNGPGNPEICDATIQHISKHLEGQRPLFGICLGHQLTALASGAQTYKLKFGHRSHNQPVLQVGTNKAFLSSQNHGFAVDDNTIQENWEPYFINMNDQSNEGLRHQSKPFFTTQFHPEASGGPTDTAFLFEDFIKAVETWKRA
jgi:carbamoyl-phosphate synthase small subunit